MRCLNLGCGRRFHSDWENLDFVAADPRVRVWDLRRGVPYPDNSFDVVYHSHVLEHFSRVDGTRFLRECERVLKSGGILRVAVPNLEGIVRMYLQALENARAHKANWAENYDWMMLELYDQTVRECSGGELAEFLRSSPKNREFIQKRIGSEADAIYGAAQERTGEPGSKWKYVAWNFGEVARNRLVRMVLSQDDYERLRLGRFRRGGEIHLWMYDSFSLARALELAGFNDPQVLTATSSGIPSWMNFRLDTDVNGSVHKPDSLFMEARKP